MGTLFLYREVSVLNRYMVVGDKLVPEDTAALILSQKPGLRSQPALIATVRYSKDSPWEIPAAVSAAEGGSGGVRENSTRSMIEKMATLNGVERADLEIRIYPGIPVIRTITDVTGKTQNRQ